MIDTSAQQRHVVAWYRLVNPQPTRVRAKKQMSRPCEPTLLGRGFDMLSSEPYIHRCPSVEACLTLAGRVGREKDGCVCV